MEKVSTAYLKQLREKRVSASPHRFSAQSSLRSRVNHTPSAAAPAAGVAGR